MTLQTINIGTTANDGTGDDLRTAFQKVNENFTTLDATAITSVTNLGDGEALYAGGSTHVLNLKTLENGDNITLTSSSNSIIISTKDSINSVIEDLTPALGGDIYTRGYSIKSSGADLHIYAYDEETYNYNKVYINSLIIDGNNINGNGTTNIQTRPFDNLKISSDLDLTLHAGGSIIFDGNVSTSNTITANSFYGDFNGLHIGPVSGNVTGNLTGNTYGVHTGNVIGNASGTVGDISNHSIRELYDVDTVAPEVGQLLKWNGEKYEPTFVIDVLIDNGNKIITNVLDPINDTDAVNKRYYENASNLTTGTLSGMLGVKAGSDKISFIRYNGLTKETGVFYGGNDEPDNTDLKLNYNGELITSKLTTTGDITIKGTNITSINGILKADGSNISEAIQNIDYITPDYQLYIGTTNIPLNRPSFQQILHGTISPLTYNLIGGNNTTMLGAIPYQSNLDTTSYIQPNTTTEIKFLSQTGDGINGGIPEWKTVSTLVATKESIGLSNVENTALSTWEGSSNITTIGDTTASKLTVTGDLIVNGTTTTINSTITSLNDPIITLGKYDSPLLNDTKDRGIEFKWDDGITQNIGFFGFDKSTGKFTFIPHAINTNETFSGEIGILDAKIEATNITGTLAKDNLPELSITDLSDVTLSSVPVNGSILTYNGTNWDTNIDINFNDRLLKNIVLGCYREKINTPSIINGVLTIDVSLGNTVVISLTENITNVVINNSYNWSSGSLYSLTLIIIQNDTTAKTLNWPSSFKWDSQSPLTVSTNLNAIDVFNLISYTNGSTWLCFPAGQDMG